jgi:hypothetical protein
LVVASFFGHLRCLGLVQILIGFTTVFRYNLFIDNK